MKSNNTFVVSLAFVNLYFRFRFILLFLRVDIRIIEQIKITEDKKMGYSFQNIIMGA